MSLTAAGAAPAANRGGKDIAFAVGIVLILCLFFLPVPAVMIDFGLATSIALSVLILMVALWIQKPLEFSAFPTVLLVATILRLALNISTTRLILSHGEQGPTSAGYIIGGFARLVMGGDFVIGIIVFLILVTINFLVITKGATRIAKVGARFTLGAIPGKQMAIDADLSAGLINEKAAQARRRELEEESAFFGSMDGASKFVRGDAIAGIIILAVNIFGGIVRISYLALEALVTGAATMLGFVNPFGFQIEGDEAMSPLATLISLAAVALLFAADLHWELLRGLVASYDVVPVGADFDARLALRQVADALGESFRLALRIASPYVIYALVVNLALALVNRLTPQIQVVFVGMPFVVAGGLVLLYFTIKPAIDAFLVGFGAWLHTG